MENSFVGPFHILEKLGTHRRHHVYRARQTEQDREVALKFITLPEDVPHETALARINREINVLRQLRHPHLVRLYGAGVEGDRVFFASELIEGETLAALLTRRGRLAPDVVIDYGKQIAEALDYLHENEIIHTRLATDKILLDASGNVFVGDVRLNRPNRRRWDAPRRATLESAAYMPPEQLLGQPPGIRADLYALGVVLFEMLTGRLPYEPHTMAQLCRDKQSRQVPRPADRVINCPAWLDGLVVRLLAPEPARRLATARAVVLTLDQIRSVNHSRKTAAEEMTRGFSALSVGADRRAARRALGIEEPESKPRANQPLMQSMAFLAGGLAVVALVAALAIFWPFGASYEDQLKKASRLVTSGDTDEVLEARGIASRIMKGTRDDTLRAEAEAIYYETRRKTMMNRLANGPSPLDRPEVHELYAVMELEKAGRWPAALERYRSLVQRIDADSEMRHVRMEAADRLERLTEARRIADELREKIRELETAASSPDATQADRDALEKARKELLAAREGNPFLTDVAQPPKENESRPPE